MVKNGKIDVSGVRAYKDLSSQQRAWITIKAKRAGKSPKMSHAGYKAVFTARLNKKGQFVGKEFPNYCSNCGKRLK